MLSELYYRICQAFTPTASPSASPSASHRSPHLQSPPPPPSPFSPTQPRASPPSPAYSPDTYYPPPKTEQYKTRLPPLTWPPPVLDYNHDAKDTHPSQLQSVPLVIDPLPTSSPRPGFSSPGPFSSDSGNRSASQPPYPWNYRAIYPASSDLPPSFASGTETEHKMDESKLPTADSQTATDPAGGDDGNESLVSEIPYFKLHSSHLSILRGQVKYLELLNIKSEGKLNKMITEYKKIIKDAKKAAVIAGIIRDDSKPAEKPVGKRRARLTVSFADEEEVSRPSESKRTKTRAASATILKRRKGNTGKRKPSPEAQATLRSCLGKRNGSSTESLSGDEEKPDRVLKKPRIRHFQEGDPLGKYVGDPDTDEEGEDDHGVKSATSTAASAPVDTKKTETTTSTKPVPTTKTAKSTSPSTTSAGPSVDNKATKATTPPTVSSKKRPISVTTPVANTNTSTPPTPLNKAGVEDEILSNKSSKKQKQKHTPAAASAHKNHPSSAEYLCSIRSSPPSKHLAEEVPEIEKSAKKQKQKLAPAASNSHAADANSTATDTATNVRSPNSAKRSAGGMNAPQLNTKRNKKNHIFTEN